MNRVMFKDEGVCQTRMETKHVTFATNEFELSAVSHGGGE